MTEEQLCRTAATMLIPVLDHEGNIPTTTTTTVAAALLVVEGNDTSSSDQHDIVVHYNPSAVRMFSLKDNSNHDDDRQTTTATTKTTTTTTLITDLIRPIAPSVETSWKEATQCQIIWNRTTYDDNAKEATATTNDADTCNSSSSSNSTVNMQVVALSPCPCCSRKYRVVYFFHSDIQQEQPILAAGNDSNNKNSIINSQLLEASFDPVFTVDETGTILSVNPAALQVFGYAKSQDMLGQNISMICGGGHAAHHEAYMRAYLQTGIAKVIGTRREVLAKRADGTEFPVALGLREIMMTTTTASTPTGQKPKRIFCGYLQDLSAQKQHDAELEQAAALCQGMINASFDPMMQLDQNGIIRMVNDSACILFGYKRHELIGSNVSLLCGEGHGAHHDSYIQRYLQTGEAHIIGRKRHVKAKRKDGTEFAMELGVQQVELNAAVAAAVGGGGGSCNSNSNNNNNKKELAFCGYMRDLTQQNKDKRALRKQAAIIHDKFFMKEENRNVEKTE